MVGWLRLVRQMCHLQLKHRKYIKSSQEDATTLWQATSSLTIILKNRINHTMAFIFYETRVLPVNGLIRWVTLANKCSFDITTLTLT